MARLRKKRIVQDDEIVPVSVSMPGYIWNILDKEAEKNIRAFSVEVMLRIEKELRREGKIK